MIVCDHEKLNLHFPSCNVMKAYDVYNLSFHSLKNLCEHTVHKKITKVMKAMLLQKRVNIMTKNSVILM